MTTTIKPRKSKIVIFGGGFLAVFFSLGLYVQFFVADTKKAALTGKWRCDEVITGRDGSFTEHDRTIDWTFMTTPHGIKLFDWHVSKDNEPTQGGHYLFFHGTYELNGNSLALDQMGIIVPNVQNTDQPAKFKASIGSITSDKLAFSFDRDDAKYAFDCSKNPDLDDPERRFEASEYPALQSL